MEWTCIYTLHSIYAIIECSVHRNPEPEHAAECPQIQSWCLNFDVPLLRGKHIHGHMPGEITNIPTLKHTNTFNIQWTQWTHVVTPVITIRALHGYCRFDPIITPIIPGRNRSEFHVTTRMSRRPNQLLSNFQGKESLLCFAWYNYYCATAWACGGTQTRHYQLQVTL